MIGLFTPAMFLYSGLLIGNSNATGFVVLIAAILLRAIERYEEKL